MKSIKKHLEVILPEITQIRHMLHTIPELKYEEIKTAELIAQTLIQYGYQVQTQIAKTGVVAILDTGRPGKTIALRADMDALPIQEPQDNTHCSQHNGIMHACGHDGHCATLLAVAYVLQQMKSDLCGKIKFIFQPAEEGGKGSTAMIEAGVLENPKVDEIYGYHNWPGLEEGIIATKEGTILLGNGRIEINITGKPAHTAQPENAINPVVIGAEAILALEEIRVEMLAQNNILNVIAFNSGDFKNGMSNDANLIAVYYIHSENELAKIENKIKEIVESIKTRYKTEAIYSIHPFHSPTVNSKSESKLVLGSCKKVFGNEKVIVLQKSMRAAEDFSIYLQHVSGCFFLVGAGESANPVHTPDFIFDDKIIAVAAETFCQIVIDSLAKN